MNAQPVSEGSWLEISRDDFLDALKRLKPGRMLKAYLSKELQLGLFQGEAVFCLEGAQTRRPARGSWNGFVCLPYGMLLPFLKIKPETDTVRLTYIGGRLCIGTTRFKAQWIEVSPWIGQMAMEAHFHGASEQATPKRFCTQCGAREGVTLDALYGKKPLSREETALLAKLENTQASHGCTACRHGWKELNAG